MKLQSPVGGIKSLLISESLRLNWSFKQLIHSGTNETPSCCSETRNSAVALFGIIFVGEIEQKNRKYGVYNVSLYINFLFIELLYKINITFVIMLIFWRKIKLYEWYKAPIFLIFMHFNRTESCSENAL